MKLLKKIKYKSPSHFVKCDCFGHLLEIRREREVRDGGKIEDKSFEISVWGRATEQQPFCWRERIRWCWHVLKTGQPWADMMIISDEKAKKLARFIQTQIEQK